MEIKLGIADVAREVTLESEEHVEEVRDRLAAALETDGGILELDDVKGRKVIVPAKRIGYIEFGSPNARPVGFGAV